MSKEWWQESPAAFADGFSETTGLHLSSEDLNELLTILNMAFLDADVLIRQSHDTDEIEEYRKHQAAIRKWTGQLSRLIGK